MAYKKEPCRNFQRGSCQYGDRCKFAHVIPQQQKSSGFGFGTQTGSQQQQKPNPFGFGIQNNSQSKAVTDFGSKPNQFKPFENKWSRSSSTIPADTASSRQSDNQSQAGNHKCTDAEACKRQIADDFQNEKPLWKLTCYGHSKNAPCDIVGDVSYEELRAVAYDDAKHGMSFQSIVERERKLLNTKLAEFDNLLHKQYATTMLPNRTFASQNSLSQASPHVFPQTAQSIGPPSLSSFSQLGASLNTGPSAPANNVFGQSITLPTQTSSAFGMVNSPSGGFFGSQHPAQTLGRSFPSNVTGFSNNITVTGENNLVSTSAELHLVNNPEQENSSADVNMWLKDKWSPGEIPEAAPADRFV